MVSRSCTTRISAYGTIEWLPHVLFLHTVLLPLNIVRLAEIVRASRTTVGRDCALAAVLINARNPSGQSLGDDLAMFFVRAASAELFPLLMGLYSGFLGLFVPSGGGRWRRMT